MQILPYVNFSRDLIFVVQKYVSEILQAYECTIQTCFLNAVQFDNNFMGKKEI
jgi:hypothetical protein